MKYNVIGDGKLADDNISKILLNRGIKDIVGFLNLNSEMEYDYSLLDNIELAKKCFMRHIESNSKFCLIVDPDVDGYTSSAIVYNYIKDIDSNCSVEYLIHDNKEHGLSSEMMDKIQLIANNIDILIIPDAGSNDDDNLIKLVENYNFDIIVLDHHEVDSDKKDYIKINNSEIIIVNNQLSLNYPNKQLSGVGVVYKFLQSLDDELWVDFSSKYLDLVAVGNIADVMDLRELETRYLVKKGLLNLNNKFIQAVFDKMSYSTSGIFNINNIGWYIVPLINNIIRNGDNDIKKNMFEAFIENDMSFEYKNKKTQEIIMEDIYTKVAREGYNLKQTSSKKLSKIIDELVFKIDDNINENKLIMVDITEYKIKSMSGLIASKLTNIYNRPCIVYAISDGICRGSGRNCDNSFNNYLKDYLSSLNLFDLVEGHQSAFGVVFKEDVISVIQQQVDKDYENIQIAESQIHDVDFDLDINELSIDIFREIDKLKNEWGNKIFESCFLIKNIKLNTENIELQTRNNITFKIQLDGLEIKFIKFFTKEGEPLNQLLSGWQEHSDIELNVIGKLGLNTYLDSITPQITIIDYEIV